MMKMQREAVKKYAIAQGRNLNIDINDKKKCQRVGVRCVEGCPFRIYGWEHSIVQTPSAEIVDLVREKFKIIISRDFAYKVKLNAHKKLHRSMKEHYTKVMNYFAALKQSGPTVILQFNVLSLDRCFIKTFLGGMLLSVVGRDPNRQMYPLAWAIVEGENKESRKWFVSELKKCVPSTDGGGWTIISDEHKSIIRAVQMELPQAEHRHCGRHNNANWSKVFKGQEMKLLF
ncbi:uncharacterized protein LOC130808362 [Amaranthus tricolor]|uniref:uncharacterized protein LOC130808362 n=1 Tax=Amaranthus tricolor TaxID=29722 RepID=UPI00258BCF66|nr:uncharacterized protein LOC130808362 [Amaranthus tricolor]